MSLFGSMQIASNALQVNDIGLQVVGQNIANANTPGYQREELDLTPAPGQQMGPITLGMGVQVATIRQDVDEFLQARLRTATSDASNASAQQSTYTQLEQAINGLGTSGTGGMLTSFFNSINQVINQPESVSARNAVVLQGTALTQNINQLGSQVAQMRQDINSQVVSMASDINRLVEQVRSLNVQIASIEGGTNGHSDAVGLTDQREQALQNLSQLVGVTTQQQVDGTISVYCGSTYLVNGGASQQVEAVLQPQGNMSVANIHLVGSDAPLDTSSGELYGLVQSRDTVLGGFQTQLDSFANTLSFEFNKVYSSGQGLSGYQTLTGTTGVDSASDALNAAGLPNAPASGSFNIQVTDANTGNTTTKQIFVNLDGPGKPTTLNDIISQLGQVSGLSASVAQGGKLSISTNSSNLSFTFSDDTSGTLAALGLNTFFQGNTATGLTVNPLLTSDPGKFAASQGGVAADSNNATALAALGDQPLADQNGNTLNFLYDQITADVTQNSATATSAANAAKSYQTTLTGQVTSVSGVSIDQEAVQMMAYQNAYVAEAKFISTLSSLFDTLVKL